MMAAMTLQISVLGRGAWGRTLIGLLERQGHHCRSWSRSDGGLPPRELLEADLVVSAVAMAGLAAVAAPLASEWPEGLPLLSCSKGLDPERLLTASQLWVSILGPQTRVAVLSGPNLALELERGLPAASVLASADPALSLWLQQQLSSEVFRLYRNDDPLGTELAGALKNVMAIASGICDGLSLGANAKASLLCRGLAEMGCVIAGLGAQSSTLYGLAGLGDLLATANSTLSRNYRFGLLLASGLGAAAAVDQIGATVEGSSTARAVLHLAHQRGWHLPICEQVLAVIDGRVPLSAVITALMGRELKAEQPA